MSSEEQQYSLCLNGYTNYQSTINSTIYISKILNSIGIPNANFVVRPCRYTNNAVATIYRNKRYILYDDIFLNILAEPKHNSYYLNLFILAHEIGHHLLGHTLEYNINISISQRQEIEADEFAGYIIAKSGGTKGDITNALKALPHPTNNENSHPTYEKRLYAALKGYSRVVEEEKSIISKYEQELKAHYIKEITSKYSEHLYTKNLAGARIEVFNYQLNGNTVHLENAIKFYLQASNTKDDIQVISELANTYNQLGNLENAQLYYDIAYNLSKDPTYLLLYWDIYSQKGTIKANYKDILEQWIESIDYINIIDYTAAKALSRYNSLKASTNTSVINNENIHKALNILDYIIKDSLYVVPGWSTLSQMNLADVYSDLSVNYNTISDFEKSYKNIVQAASLYQKLEKEEVLDIVGKENYNKTLGNKALIEMRLGKWNEVISTTNKLLLKDIHSSDIHYFKGRALAALGKHKDAIEEYTFALKIMPTASYLYFYRGLSNAKLSENIKQGIIDLNTACSAGIEPACEAIQKITK